MIKELTHQFMAAIVNANNTNLPQPTATGAKIQDILSIVFAIAGAVSVLVIVIAGFMMVISSGEPAKVAKARQSIIYAVVGLFVCIFAFTIVTFVVGKVG